MPMLDEKKKKKNKNKPNGKKKNAEIADDHIVTEGGKPAIVYQKSRAERAAERGVDSWIESGCSGRWRRIHRTPRRALFTPFRVAGGPAPETEMNKRRVTKGRFIGSKEEFEITDDFTKQSSAHRLLRASWIGETTFCEVKVLAAEAESCVDKSEQVDKIKKIPRWSDISSNDDEEIINRSSTRDDSAIRVCPLQCQS